MASMDGECGIGGARRWRPRAGPTGRPRVGPRRAKSHPSPLVPGGLTMGGEHVSTKNASVLDAKAPARVGRHIFMGRFISSPSLPSCASFPVSRCSEDGSTREQLLPAGRPVPEAVAPSASASGALVASSRALVAACSTPRAPSTTASLIADPFLGSTASITDGGQINRGTAVERGLLEEDLTPLLDFGMRVGTASPRCPSGRRMVLGS